MRSDALKGWLIIWLGRGLMTGSFRRLVFKVIQIIKQQRQIADEIFRDEARAKVIRDRAMHPCPRRRSEERRHALRH